MEDGDFFGDFLDGVEVDEQEDAGEEKEEKDVFAVPLYQGVKEPRQPGWQEVVSPEYIEQKREYRKQRAAYCVSVAERMKGIPYRERTLQMLKLEAEARRLWTKGGVEGLVDRLEADDRGEGFSAQIPEPVIFEQPDLRGKYFPKLDGLPHGLLMYLMEYVDGDDLFSLMLTCKYVYNDCGRALEQRALQLWPEREGASKMCCRAVGWIKRAVVKKMAKKKTSTEEDRFALSHERWLGVKMTTEKRHKFRAENAFDDYVNEIVNLALVEHYSMEHWLMERRIKIAEKVRCEKEKERVKKGMPERVKEMNDYMAKKLGRPNPFLFKEVARGYRTQPLVPNPDVPDAALWCEMVHLVVGQVEDVISSFCLGRKLNGLSVMEYRFHFGVNDIFRIVGEVNAQTNDPYVPMTKVGDYNICSWIRAGLLDHFVFTRDKQIKWKEQYYWMRNEVISFDVFEKLLRTVLNQKPDSDWIDFYAKESEYDPSVGRQAEDDDKEVHLWYSMVLNISTFETYFVRRKMTPNEWNRTSIYYTGQMYGRPLFDAIGLEYGKYYSYSCGSRPYGYGIHVICPRHL